MYYIYILYSPSAQKYYTGYTSNYQKRFLEHNSQEYFDTYTSKHRPWELKAIFEAGLVKGTAMKLERFIKKQKSRKLLEQLINPSFIPIGPLAQLVRVSQLRD